MDDRLSYLQSIEDGHCNELAAVINPRKNLNDVFNSVCEDEIETEHLKVYLRMRPLLSEENISVYDGNIEVMNHRSILLTAPCNSHAFKNRPHGITKVSHRFTFTHVYDQGTSQHVLFEETTRGLVNDLISGQNCLLFTYGATNSGKTYTIQGPASNRGLLPRTLDTLFGSIGNRQYKGIDLKPQHFCGVVRMTDKETRKEQESKEEILKASIDLARNSFSKSSLSFSSSCLSQETDCQSLCNGADESVSTGVSESDSKEEVLCDGNVDSSDAIFAIFVSYAEIYNEYIYDLLDKQSFSNKKKRNPLTLGEDRHGAIYIKGLQEIRVKNVEEAVKVMNTGKQNLHFAATKLNHQSSRSHCIFTIKLLHLADPDYPHVARVSMLSICDLAGAERAGKTLNSMDRLKEASNINTSLLVLGRCMAALRQNQIVAKQPCGPKRQIPIPYRDSKVTRLFQSFFMGRGKVAMIVNISMSCTLFDETLKVLKFSALASKVTITQEKPPVDQLVAKKSSNNFSRFLHQSLNMSASSGGRFSVPWGNKSYSDVTFGAVEQGDNSCMVAVPEESEKEEEEDEEDERYEALMQLIDKLKERLIKECIEKNELEERLRKEISDAFGKRLVKIEETWRNRMEEQEAQAEELMEWRLNNVLSSVRNADGCRKRLRTEPDSDDDYDDDDEEKVPAILLVREEIKVKNLEDEKHHMQEELTAVTNSLKVASQVLKRTQEEKSNLVFQLANVTKRMNELQKQAASLKQSSESFCIDDKNDDCLKLVVLELQDKIAALQKTQEEKDSELKTVKDLLVEAAEEYQEKDHLVQTLRTQLDSSNKNNTNQSVLMSELENQLSEMKAMFTSQGIRLEEREQEIHELQTTLYKLKVKDHSCSSSEIGEDRNEESVQETNDMMSQLAQEKEDVMIELTELKAKAQNTADLEGEIMGLKQEINELAVKLFPETPLKTSQDELELKRMTQGQLIEQMRQEIDTLKSQMVSHISKNDQREKVLEEELDRKEKEVAELEQLCSDLSCKLQAFNTNHYLERLAEHNAQLKEEKESLIKTLSESNHKIDELYGDKDNVNGQLRILIESNGKLESRMKKAIEERELFAISLAELEQQLREIQTNGDDRKSKESLLEELAELASISNSKDEQVSLLSKNLKAFEEENLKLQCDNTELNEIITLKEMSIKDLWRDTESLRELHDKCICDLDDLKTQNETLSKKVEELEEETNSSENKLHDATAAAAKLSSEVDEMRTQLSDIEEERAKWQTTIKELQLNLLEEKEKADKETEELRSHQSECELQNSELSATLTRLKGEMKAMKIENSSIVEQLQSQEVRQTSANEEVVRELKSTQKDLKEFNNKLEEELRASEESNRKLEEELKVSEESNRKLEEELRASGESNRKLEEELTVLEESNRKLELELRSLEESNRKLELEFRSLEDSNSKLELELRASEEQQNEYKEQLDVLWTLKDENIKLKEMLAAGCKKEKDLEELHFKSRTEIHSLSLILEEKGETVTKMAAKIESLDAKVTIAEDELHPFKNKCEILEKEVAALREARNEEKNRQRTEIEERESALVQKDEEISALQQEVKRLLQVKDGDEDKVPTKVSARLNIKAEEDKVSVLQNQLRASEEENATLRLEFTALQKELQQFQQEHQSLQESGQHVTAPPKPCRKQVYQGLECSDVTESDSVVAETPSASAKSTRTRNRKPKTPLISIENATPDSLRLTLDTSEGEDLGSAVKSKATRRRRGRPRKTSHVLDTSVEDDFKVPTYRRKPAQSKEPRSDDDADEWQPRNAEKKKSRTRTKSKLTSSSRDIFNPHLEDKENKASCATTVTEETEAAKNVGNSQRGRKMRGRRQRPLYNANIESEPFECAPNLIMFPANEDSPHTTVRRILRSKSRAK